MDEQWATSSPNPVNQTGVCANLVSRARVCASLTSRDARVSQEVGLDGRVLGLGCVQWLQQGKSIAHPGWEGLTETLRDKANRNIQIIPLMTLLDQLTETLRSRAGNVRFQPGSQRWRDMG